MTTLCFPLQLQRCQQNKSTEISNISLEFPEKVSFIPTFPLLLNLKLFTWKRVLALKKKRSIFINVGDPPELQSPVLRLSSQIWGWGSFWTSVSHQMLRWYAKNERKHRRCGEEETERRWGRRKWEEPEVHRNRNDEYLMSNSSVLTDSITKSDWVIFQKHVLVVFFK